jgi:hypothetical protein
MSPTVWAALIQGGLTVFAALIAVWGVSRQVSNWRHEVPGRRKIEIAEQCLVAADAQKGLIEHYRDKVIEGMDLYIDPEGAADRQMEHEDGALYWVRLEGEIEYAAVEVAHGYVKLKAATELAEVYFADSQWGLSGGLGKMRSAGTLVSSRRGEFFDGPANQERRRSVRSLMEPPNGIGSSREYQDDIAIGLYRRALQP